MKISEISVEAFKYRTKVVRDEEGHTHAGEEHDATQALVTVKTDEGAEGYAFGAGRDVVKNVVEPAIGGMDPFDREKIWQRLRHFQRINPGGLTDRVVGVIDLALWDLAGRHLNMPVHKLLGGFRDKVLAYGSTMCGDEDPNGLSTPEEYGRFAEWLVKERGYKAVKLHTWMPPISWAPSPKMDVRACAAVREAVGPDVPLMLDCYHYYDRLDALWIGRELEKLDYHWFEEPMDEHSTSSYAWLAEQLAIPVIGPEVAEGKMQTRAEWIVRGACDITRGGVGDVGGLTPLMKTAHLAEAFNMAMEVHGGGPGNLNALGAMGIPGEMYERGLLHPFIDYDQPPGYLNSLFDPMDDEGYVHMPTRPGIGMDINFDYIRGNLV